MKKTLVFSLIVPLTMLAFSFSSGSALACSTGCGFGFDPGFGGTNTNTVTDSNTVDTTVSNNNTADITNNVSVDAETGDNTASGGVNTGGSNGFLGNDGNESSVGGGTVVTGDADAESSIANYANSNQTALAVPTTVDETPALLGEVEASNAADNDDNGFGFGFGGNENVVTDLNNVNTNVDNVNNSGLTNNQAVTAFTGNNTASGGLNTNTGDNGWNSWDPCFSGGWFGNNSNCGIGETGITTPNLSNTAGGAVFTGNTSAGSNVVNYLNFNASWLQ